MGEETQQQLWNDSFEDALRAAAEAVGPKTMAGELWPEKPVQQAAQLLFHCLNIERSEKLTASQIALVIRRGREAGCHAPMHFLAADSHYASPQPMEPEDERAKLQREFIEAQKQMQKLAERMERLS